MNGTMTRDQAAEYLNVSLPTIDAYIHRESAPLPHIKAGRKYLIPTAMLNEWLVQEAQRQTSGEAQ